MNIAKKLMIIMACSGMAMVMHAGDPPFPLVNAELRLQTLFSEISRTNTDHTNSLINDSILIVLEKALNLPGSFKYPFDSLKRMGKVTSADQKVRIFSWNIFSADATNTYFGFVLHNRDKNQTDIYRLSDSSATTRDPLFARLDAGHWYGCLIYDIVDQKVSGETCYTLLAFDPENLFISKKIVDILWFSNDKPLFGNPVFHFNKSTQSRIIFEYSAKVQMSLVWNKGMNMIVFDHLSPSDPSNTGNFQYYGPDFTFSALKFDEGFWELKENVDIRNK